MKEVHKSLGGGKIKEGTLITSTKTSHKIKSAAKKIIGSMMLFTEDFTSTSSEADVRRKLSTCQGNCRRPKAPGARVSAGFHRAAFPAFDGSSRVPAEGIVPRPAGTFRRQYNGRYR